MRWSTSSGSRSGCNASPCRRRKQRSPQIVSIRCSSSFSAMAEKLSTSHLQTKDVADKVVLVQPLHNEQDCAGALVVGPANETVANPSVADFPWLFGQRLFGLRGITDPYDVAPASSQHPAGGGGEAIALASGDELLYGLAVCGKTGREDPPIPRAHHDAAAIAGEL